MGYRLPFSSSPPLSSSNSAAKLLPYVHQGDGALWRVSALLAKGAIELAPPPLLDYIAVFLLCGRPRGRGGP